MGDREIQQDSCDIFEKDGRVLLAIGDGLGGHKGGAQASQIFIKEAKNGFKTGKNPKTMFEDIIKGTQERLKELKQNHRTLNPHTTCALALIDDKKLYFCHMGDSRIYLFFGQDLIYQSKDHSVVQMLVGLGEIKEEQMSSHPDKHKILRSICADIKPKMTYKEVDIVKGDFTVLLCSDGLWENLTKDEIKEYLFSSPLQQSLEKMIKAIKDKNQNPLDNISIMAYGSTKR